MDTAKPTGKPGLNAPPAEGGTLKAPRLYPVIHFLSTIQTVAQAELAIAAGAHGVFLVNMGGPSARVDTAAIEIKMRHPDAFVGINRLDMMAPAAIHANVLLGVDGTWTDDAGIHSSGLKPHAHEASGILEKLERRGRKHLFFAAVAFKYQEEDKDPATAAALARNFGWIPTTSGPGTGVAADTGSLELIRNELKEWPLGLASGVTPENVHLFLPHATAILVSTGITVAGDEYSFDEEKLQALVAAMKPAKGWHSDVQIEWGTLSKDIKRRMKRYDVSIPKLALDADVPEPQVVKILNCNPISARSMLGLCRWLKANPYRYLRSRAAPGIIEDLPD